MESWSFRHFLIDEDDRLWRVSRRVSEDLVAGRDRLPQFADKRIRSVQAGIGLVDGNPVTLDYLGAFYWEFDSTGRLVVDLRSCALSLERIASAPEALRTASKY